MTDRSIRSVTMVLAAAGAFALAGCTPKPAAVDTTKEADALKAWVTQYNADYKAHDVAKITADQEATVEGYVPFTSLRKGTGDAKQNAADFAADPALSLELKVDRAEVSKGGDLGYVIGDFTRTATNPKTKAAESSTGGYTVVLRKQADGSWKLVAYTASQGPPAARPAKT
jgi:ketosteroid isomerase-like protein